MSEAARITTSSGKSVEEINIPSLVSIILKHEVKATSAMFNWTGPSIDRLEWAAMMAFFEWTYETEKSEAQVRWYVHPQHGWKCWAFPQKGGTSMTTKEIADHPNAAVQRQQFDPAAGWLYFMTVHHHCSTGAFQSGTDHADEVNVDGIHITIGNMDKPNRDIHVRLYIKGHEFKPFMHEWWGIPDGLVGEAKKAEDLFGFKVDWDLVARKDMAKSSALIRAEAGVVLADADSKFNETWKANYIVEKPQLYIPPFAPGRFLGNAQETYEINGKTVNFCQLCGRYTDHKTAECPRGEVTMGKNVGGEGLKVDEKPIVKNTSCATLIDDIRSRMAILGYTDEEMSELMAICLEGQYADGIAIVIGELSEAHDISASELWDYWQDTLLAEELKEDRKEADRAKIEMEDETAKNGESGSQAPNDTCCQDPNMGWGY
jgi:hypothetical protein